MPERDRRTASDDVRDVRSSEPERCGEAAAEDRGKQTEEAGHVGGQCDEAIEAQGPRDGIAPVDCTDATQSGGEEDCDEMEQEGYANGMQYVERGDIRRQLEEEEIEQAEVRDQYDSPTMAA